VLVLLGGFLLRVVIVLSSEGDLTMRWTLVLIAWWPWRLHEPGGPRASAPAARAPTSAITVASTARGRKALAGTRW